jgi:RNA polymerase sigma-70 factor (ECF subfamily)
VTAAGDHSSRREQGDDATSDEALLAEFVRGNEDTFTELVRRYRAPIHTLICRLTGDPMSAPDLLQETLVRVARGASSFAGRSSFKTWLYAIAVNVCRAYGRKAKPRPAALQDVAGALVSDSPNPVSSAEYQELNHRIAETFAALPQRVREVLVLSIQEELSHQEIAETLGRPLGTVKTQLRRAMPKVRAALRDIAEAYGIPPRDGREEGS